MCLFSRMQRLDRIALSVGYCLDEQSLLCLAHAAAREIQYSKAEGKDAMHLAEVGGCCLEAQMHRHI